MSNLINDASDVRGWEQRERRTRGAGGDWDGQGKACWRRVLKEVRERSCEMSGEEYSRKEQQVPRAWGRTRACV